MFTTPRFTYCWNAFQLLGCRARQEDNVRGERLTDDPTRWFFAVADGLGGHLNGDWASRTAIQATRDHLKSVFTGSTSRDLPNDDLWNAAMTAAQRQVRDLAKLGFETLSAPASTMVAGVADEGGRVSLRSIGDSSVWHLHEDQIDLVFGRQGSDDWVAAALGFRGLWFDAPESVCLQLADRDRLVFATDGIETLPPEVLAALFRLPIDEATGELILAIAKAANPHQDNVTVLIVEARQFDPPEDAS